MNSAEEFVYIVDDDEAVRDATQLLLETHDIPARSFANGQAFLSGFDPDKAVCVLLDLHMPEMSGLELVEILRTRQVPTPIIVISGRRFAALDAQVERAGAVAILSKPYDEDEFIGLIEKVRGRPRF